MTEPGTGSDLAAVQTTARRDGDSYVINGSKIFISNGQIADLSSWWSKTDPKANPPHRGISLILVDGDAPGFVRGRKLDKLGFQAARTPASCSSRIAACRSTNLLGREGNGFKMLMEKLQQERLVTAVGATREHAAMPRRHHRIHQAAAAHSASRSRRFRTRNSSSPR